MYLKKIKVSNFRGFDENGIEAVFDKGVNAIIGENNNGKSSLVDAIRIAFSTLSYKKDIYFNLSDFHVNLLGEVTKSAQFDVYFEEVPRYLIEIWNPETPSSGEFHIKFYMAKTPKGIDKIQYSIWGGSIEGNLLSQETLDTIDVVFLGALRDAESEMKPSRNSKLAELLGNIADSDEKRKDLLDILQEANKELMKKPEIFKARQIINNNLANIEHEILSQHIDIGLIEPKFESITASLRGWIKSKWIFVLNENPIMEELEQIIDNHRLGQYIRKVETGLYLNTSIFLQKINDNAEISQEFKDKLNLLMQRNFELKQNGLGYNNLIYMSTILGDMSIKKEGVLQNLLLVEEPEAHLHPQLQELVHNFFEDQYMEDKNIQVIYTSHSPTLVSKINLDKINLIFEKEYRVECLPLSETSADEDDKKYLKKYLDVTKSQLFFSKGIIFVEGISEALLIPEIALYLGLPLDKYAVEVVNVDSLAFKPFANLLFKSTDSSMAFAKSVIITDDDRCTNSKDKETYISKDIDFDDDLTGIQEKLDSGKPSMRYENISVLCDGKDIKLSPAYKTLEYELAFCEENISLIISIIKEIYVDLGVTLENHVKNLGLKEKQLCIWLFIRYRDKSKGEIAQKLCAIIQDQKERMEKGEEVENKFQVPQYIKDSIEHVTASINGGE